jgi:GT2 family glycosyltransferase
VYIKHIGVDEVDRGQFEQAKPTEFITGCLMLMDKTVVKTVGLWDESYFLYYEDADYCRRAAAKNIPLVYDPSLAIWHKNAQSTDGPGSAIHRRFQNMNRLKFGLKYAPMRTRLHLLKDYLLSKVSAHRRPSTG